MLGGGYLATQTNNSGQLQNQAAKDSIKRAILGGNL
jgi:hypothetical protein